jgi:hypothetical protein
VVFAAAVLLAAVYVGYVLWPRWPSAPVPPGAAALPISVGGAMFVIEPAAIRVPVQRRPGTQERVDLAYLWPSLLPPSPEAQTGKETPVDPNERLFVTIANGDETLPVAERVRTIYPRYLADSAAPDRNGLMRRAFRDGTPYQGEDLLYDAAAPDRFTARCSRTGIGNTGLCLLERRIGNADITLRFPRDWLTDWTGVADGIDRLMARLHPG